ncbi:MAG: VIT domain-containing protein, partial [Pirellulales bacterium]
MRRALIAALANVYGLLGTLLLTGLSVVPLTSLGAKARASEPAGAIRPAADDAAASSKLRQGTLLVAEQTAGSWRWLNRGDDCPPKSLLRVPETAPSSIAWSGATLTADAGSQFTLSDNRTAVLNRGRLYLETTPNASLRSIKAAEVSIEVPAGSALEVSLTDDDTVVAIVTRAPAHDQPPIAALAPGSHEAQAIAPGFAFSYGPRKESRTYLPLDHAEQQAERIAAWTAAAQPTPGLGQMVVDDPQSERAERLNIARSHVNLVLAPPVALVQLDQSFYNPQYAAREGTFVFNLPRGASVSRFAMYVTANDLIEGELIDRRRAADVYDRIVSGRRDPAILEQLGDNLFRMRVFPILPHDVKRILLDFTLPLAAVDGRCRFELPLLSDLEPIWDFRITGTVRGVSTPDKLLCRTLPELTFASQADGAVKFEFARRNYQPTAPLDIEFPLAAPAEPTLRTYAAPALPPRPQAAPDQNTDDVPIWQDPWAGRSATYFLATLPPLDKPRPADAEPPVDVLILADTSGATAPQESVRQAVRSVVRNLRPIDRFRLACADVALRPLDDSWLAPGTPDARDVLAEFEQQVFLGASDLVEVLLAAGGMVGQVPEVAAGEPAGDRPAGDGPDAMTDRRRLIVYVGDGINTHGEIAPGELADKVAGRINAAGAHFVAAIVRDDSRGFANLDLLARQTGGMLISAPGGAADSLELLRWVVAGLPSPRGIISLSVAGVDDGDLFYPASWSEGRGLPIFGRLGVDTHEVRIEITTRRDGAERSDTFRMPLPAEGDDLFIGRLWAQERLGHLQRRQQEQQFTNRWLDQEMIGLSQQWTLLSPLTAFLVLETEKDYARWNIDRQQRRRYWQPSEAVATAPLPADWLARVRPAPQPDPLGDPAFVARAIANARLALAEGQTRQALVELERIHRSPLVPEILEYAELLELARQVALREAALEMLGFDRVLVDRGAEVHRDPAELQLARPVAGHFPAEFLERHPHAVPLLQEVSFPSAEITLPQLVRLLRDLTKANVDLDVAALDEAGIVPDLPLRFMGFGKFSLRDFVFNLLMPQDLVLVDEPGQLIITTTEEAQNRLQTEVYPVADLLLSDRVASFDQLIDPYADHQLAREERIRQRLLKPIAVDFTETPLVDVAWALAQQLNIPVVVDEAALDLSGIAPDTPITIHREAMPARDALRWFLQEHDLTYAFANGAMLITTQEEAQNRLHTRLHSGIGVLGEYPVSDGPNGLRNRFLGPGMFGGMGGTGINGMGGMGMGGIAGGMSGGMGGMGGGIGGMAMFGPSSTAPLGGQSVAFGGVQEPAGPTADDTEADKPAGAQPAAEAAGAQGAAPTATVQPNPIRYVVDADSPIEIITSTIYPTTWEDVGGQGAIEFYRPTLDLVVSGTEEVHDQIESLLAKLRKLPPIGEGRFGMRLAEPRPLVEQPDQMIDFDSLIDLITTHCSPTTWEDVGGQGSIDAERVRLALIFSQTDSVHAEVSRLLTLLRRSRWEQLFGTRPWEMAPGSGGVLSSGWLLRSADVGRRSAELPAPQPQELTALSIRRELTSGNLSWRRTPIKGAEQGPAAEQFSLAVSKGRRQFAQADRTLIIDGDDAAVAYPGFDLVELGVWGQAARDTIDGWLPWLPHRSNAELAARFDVTVVPPADDQPGQAGADRQRKLRFAFPAQGAAIYLEVTFSDMHGLPIAWESYVDGHLAQRLRFADFQATKAGPQWHQVTLEDAAGKLQARWELLASENRADVPKLGDPFDAPSLGKLTRFDRRPATMPRDADLTDTVAAIERRDWEAAVAAVDVLLAGDHERPLPLFLKAWCREQQGEPLRGEALVDVLSRVTASSAVGLTRMIAAGTPGFLSAGERYAVLNAQPAAERSHDDWAHLAHWAMEAGKRDEALECIDRSLEPDDVEPGYRFARQMLRAEILLALDRAADVEEIAESFAQDNRAAPADLAHLAGLLARFGKRELAEMLLAAALDRDALPAEERYELLIARAACQVGLARWRTLIEAELLLAGDAPHRGTALATVLGELHQPLDAEIAAQLAAQFPQPRVHWPLVIRQAELTVDAAAAADLWWQVYEARARPDDKLTVAC